MLISEHYGFLFVANLRTASSSIHRALQPLADVALEHTASGKHLGLAEITERFGAERVARLYTWAVVREPVSHLWSLYTFHKQPGFDGRPISTRGLSFEDFYFGDTHGWMRVPQWRRFVDATGAYRLDLLIRFEHLHAGFSYVKFRLGLPNVLLPALNASGGPPPRVAPDLVERIRSDYAVDYDTIARYGDRERTADGFEPVLRPAAPVGVLP